MTNNKQIELHADKDSLLSVVSCYDVADTLGLKMIKKGNNTYVECPYHFRRLGKSDKKLGNCVISRNGRYCNCFACGGHGDAISMVMAQRGMEFCDAVDWLAEIYAPELLSENYTNVAVKKCIYSKEQFAAIGIKTNSFLVPFGIEDSKCSARKKYPTADISYPDCFRNHQSNHPITDPRHYVLVCSRQEINISEVYRDSKDAFYSIVIPKAKDTKERCLQSIHSIKANFPEGLAKDIFLQELEHDLSISNKFISDARRDGYFC